MRCEPMRPNYPEEFGTPERVERAVLDEPLRQADLEQLKAQFRKADEIKLYHALIPDDTSTQRTNYTVPVLRNARHEKFCQELAQGTSAAEAYVCAGFRPSRQNAGRLRTREDVAGRIHEIQQAAAQSAEITLAGVLRELDQAIEIARAKGQPNALVNAAALRAKLGGLMIERQQVEVQQSEFTEDMTCAEILSKVAREAGTKAAIALAEAFQIDPASYDLSGEPVVEARPRAAAPKLGHSQHAVEERRPVNDPKREI